MILKYVFDCLLSPKASVKVCSFVMEMTVTLLALREKSDAHEMDASCDGEEISGEELVCPFVPQLLDYLSQVISASSSKGKLRTVDRRTKNLDYEFVVLSRCAHSYIVALFDVGKTPNFSSFLYLGGRVFFFFYILFTYFFLNFFIFLHCLFVVN